MRYLFTGVIIFCSFFGKTQQDREVLVKLLSSDTSMVHVLFCYPDSVRSHIFTASTYPSGFIKLDEIQKVSSSSFREVIARYNQKRQKQLWEITRYPELARRLIDNKNKTTGELEQMLSAYPVAVRDASIYFVKHDVGILISMESIRNDFDTRFKTAVESFPEGVRTSFGVLLGRPEVISMLAEDMRTTVMLGDIYTHDSVLVVHTADSIRTRTESENNKEYEDWKNGITHNQAVQDELKQVSKQYDSDDDEIYGKDHNVQTVINIMPYPYWAGYPYWWGTPYWYPYPWWYHCGFYWQTNGPIVFFGMPTYYFGWWYYQHPHYYNRYPHASDYFYHHRNSYPRSGQHFNRSVRQPAPVIHGHRR